jgi:TRAP-type C4-dicarboxylate transport system permease large subunit
MTSRFERVLAGLGFAVLFSALAWMVTFGVVFLAEVGAHKRASFNAIGHANWVVVPAIISGVLLLLGFFYGVMTDT